MQPSLPFDSATDLRGSVEPRTAAPGTEHSAQHPAPGTQRSSQYPFVFARHPRARRYVIRVTTDGTVRVTIPRRGSRREATAFAEAQRGWIEKQQQRMEAERLRRAAGPDSPLAQGQPKDERGERELYARGKRELPPRLLDLAAQHNLTVTRVSVRNQRSRWGSCSRRGHICLNWRLVTMPDWVRDYVMLHELMHLKRMDHSPRFWKLVAGVCPDYQAARRWLCAQRQP
jgi:predicted metal-dependent hydrolase